MPSSWSLWRVFGNFMMQAHPAPTRPSSDCECLFPVSQEMVDSGKWNYDICQKIVGAIKLPYSQILRKMLSLHMTSQTLLIIPKNVGDADQSS